MKIHQHLSRLSAVCLITGILGMSAAQAQSYGNDAVDMKPTFSGQSTQSQSVMNEPGQPNSPRTINPNTDHAETHAGHTTKQNLSHPVTVPNTQAAAPPQANQLSPQQAPSQTQPVQTRVIQQNANTVPSKSVPQAYRGYDPTSSASDPTPPPTINYIVEPGNTSLGTSNEQNNSETAGSDQNLSQQDIYPYLSNNDANNRETVQVDRSEQLIYADADDADNNSPFNALYILLFTVIAASVAAAVYMVHRYHKEGDVRPLG